MKQQILVVDDARLARRMLQKALHNGGFDNVEEASNAVQALEVFRASNPDLIMLDITLPDSFDLTLLKTILQEKPDAKVIMVSAIGQDLIIQDALKMGAKAFVIKPFEEKVLLQTVFEVLEAQ